MKKIFCSSLFAFFLLPTWALAEQLLNDANQQQTIYVNPKESLIVTLPANPSTGYMWQFSPPNDGTVKLAKNWKFTPSKKNTVGAGGETTWRLVAGTSGETTLQFFYRRPWEDASVAAAETREYKIVIRSTSAANSPASAVKPWF
ncbi:MAG: protease inhibitor I42 family protein [Deefgea sp.]